MCVQQFSKLCSFATSAKTHALTLEEHPGLTTGTTNQQCFVFSPSSFSVSILTSSPLSCHSASACHISPIFDHSRRRYDVLSIFKMGPLWRNCTSVSLWRHFLQKVNVYQHTKERQDNSNHSRDITISVLQKQTSVILKFFFRFRFDHIGVIRMIYSIKLPNFIDMGPPNAETWRHIYF